MWTERVCGLAVVFQTQTHCHHREIRWNHKTRWHHETRLCGGLTASNESRIMGRKSLQSPPTSLSTG